MIATTPGPTEDTGLQSPPSRNPSVVSCALVVLAVSGILYIIGQTMPGHGRHEGAQRAAAETQLDSFDVALRAYVRDNGEAPTTEQGLGALIARPFRPPLPSGWKGPYLTAETEIPKDPWGNAYLYRRGDSAQDFVIIDYPWDGRNGGSGKDEEVLILDSRGDRS